MNKLLKFRDATITGTITNQPLPTVKHNVKLIATKIASELKPRPPSQEFQLASDIVKKAIRKFADDKLADKAINGYRRSDGSDHAAELNYLKADVPKHNLKRDEHYLKALKVVKQLFQPIKPLRPVAYPDLRYYPWKLNTSAEAPFTMKKKWKEHMSAKTALNLAQDGRLNFHNLYNEIFEKNRRLFHDIKYHSKKFFKPDGTPIPYYFHSLHTRAHLVKTDDLDKNRGVFGTPKLLLQVEQSFIWPLLKTYLNKETPNNPLLWGYETFKGGWKRLYNDIYSKTTPNTFLGIDWSGFDRFALFEVIDDVHDIWESYFEFDKGFAPTNEYPTPTTDEFKIRNLWNWMKHSVKFTPARAASGNIYQFTYNGIASGFQQTQLLDSFVNAVMILTVLSALGINIESKQFILYVQGDDSLIALPERIFTIYGRSFLERIANEAKLRFNAKLNVDKSSISNSLSDIDVLSYHNRNGIAFRDTAELLAQLLYPERNYRTLGATASAAIGIAMASMGQSKVLYNICYDVWNHIINDLKAEPKPVNLNWLFNLQIDPISGSRFPTLLELKDQQEFLNKERSEDEKQHLWPTKPQKGKTEAQSFYFL